MKQPSLLPFLPLLALAFLPPNAAAQLRYGLKAGAQVTEIRFQELLRPTTGTAPMLTSLAGAVAEYELNKNTVLSAGLQVSGQGGTASYGDPIDMVYADDRYFSLCAQLPVMVRAQHRGFSVGAGLYAGLALWGRKKSTLEYSKITTVDYSTIQFGTGEDAEFARFDWGTLAEAGYSFRNFRVAAHYWLGLANVLPKFYRTDGDQRQNRTYGASLTYFLAEGE